MRGKTRAIRAGTLAAAAYALLGIGWFLFTGVQGWLGPLYVVVTSLVVGLAVWWYAGRDAGEREDAAELRAELDSFAYAVSHDLRAPLRGMTGFANALIEEYGPKFDGDGRRYLERIREAAEVMGAQVDGLLELSRVSRTEFVAGEFDAADFVRGEVRRLTDAVPGRRVELDLPGRLLLKGDERLLREAFRRLVDNAWKFSAGRDPARIQLRAEGDTVTLADNGVGFDSAYAHKLFVPFQRLHTQSEFPGTGIGLVIVQRIIRRHGGGIRLESGTGTGTAVVITMGAGENG